MSKIKASYGAAFAWLQRRGPSAILAFCLGLTLMIAVEATLDALGWL
jgi:hypothetical protein